jgi:hypothetical protein
MSMTPLYYYDNFVVPNYEDFCKDESSIRKAFNAAVSVHHMADNYFNYYKKYRNSRVSDYKKLEDFHVFLSKTSIYYNDIQSIANVYKHLYLNPEKHHVTVESGGAIVNVMTKDDDIVINGFAQNLQDNQDGFRVVYHTKYGKEIRIKDALDEIIKIWEDLIYAD